LTRNAWLVLPGALCTLATHAVAYHSFFPTGVRHGYFGWYEPLVASLSLASLAAFGLLLGLAVLGRREWPLRRLANGLAARLRAQADDGLWRRLAATSLTFFFLQESIERSLQQHGPALAALPATTWLLALLAIAAFAGLLALVARSGLELAELVLGRGAAPAVRRTTAVARPLGAVALPRRSSPLAERRGLRAPPLFAG
jgi:hypothetical protein